MRILASFAIVVACLAPLCPAAADGSLGTAGPFRTIGGATCAAGYIAQMQGKCDPPPVDQSLSPAARSQAEVERALKLIALMRLVQAKQALDAAIALDPRNIAAYKLRARMAIPGSLASAEVDVNAGLLLAPSDSDLLATRALLLRDHQDTDCTCMQRAKRDADDAIKANPKNADAFWIRAQIFRDLGKMDAAEADLSQSLVLEPDHTRARMLRAQIRMMMDRAKEAADDASVVLEQNPADISALQLRAVVRAQFGDLAGAVDDLGAILGEPGKVTNITPAAAMFGDLYLQRAILLVTVGRPDDAMRDLDTIAAIGGPQALLRLQVYLRGHGFPDVAIDGKRSESFDDAIKACFVDKACGRGLVRRS
jgi:tetratricopeptide (TPR) repeat protein